jgi:hypothetical protein
VGAWLRVWTPPRDVEVPPLPVRKALMWAAGVLLVVAALTALIAPRVDSAKSDRAAREARRLAADREARRLAAIHDQRPQFGAGSQRPAAGAPAATRLAARTALLHDAELAIGADARRRAAAGELKPVSGATRCVSAPPSARPEGDLSAVRGVYDCFIAIQSIAATNRNVGGSLGYPFRAVLDFRRYRYAFCKSNPIPGERLVPDPRTVVQLPPACRAG